LPGIGIPSKNGFLATLVGEVPSFIDLNINNILKNIKSLEDRALSQAKNISISDKMNELAENESVDKMNLYFKAIDWLKTEDGKEALLKKTESVKEKLIPVITEDILNADLKEFDCTNACNKVKGHYNPGI
jgi:hypothetical protein